MAIVVFGNFALEWTKVYAVLMIEGDVADEPAGARVYIDLPGKAGDWFQVDQREIASAVWRQANADPKLLRADGGFCFDASRFVAAIQPFDGSPLRLWFALADGKCANIVMPETPGRLTLERLAAALPPPGASKPPRASRTKKVTPPE